MLEIKRYDDKINVPAHHLMKATLQVLASRRGYSLAVLTRIALLFYIDHTCAAEYAQIYNELSEKETLENERTRTT